MKGRGGMVNLAQIDMSPPALSPPLPSEGNLLLFFKRNINPPCCCASSHNSLRRAADTLAAPFPAFNTTILVDIHFPLVLRRLAFMLKLLGLDCSLFCLIQDATSACLFVSTSPFSVTVAVESFSFDSRSLC